MEQSSTYIIVLTLRTHARELFDLVLVCEDRDVCVCVCVVNEGVLFPPCCVDADDTSTQPPLT
jgi:hypothetical protein